MSMPEFDDQALLGHLLDPAADPAAAEAIRGNDALRARLEELRRMLTELDHLRSANADWHVSRSQREALYELGAARPTGWFAALRARASEMIATLAPGAGSGGAALTGFRSGAGARVLSYECEGIEIDLRVTPRFAGDIQDVVSDFELLGQIVGAQPATAVRVEPLGVGALRESRLTTPEGFEAVVGPGVYEITISLPERAVVIPRLELTVQPNDE